MNDQTPEARSTEPTAEPLALRLNDQLGPLPPEHAAVCKAVNDDATLQSLLYDLNLLPEQTQRDPLRWGYTVAVVAHFDVAVTAERLRLNGLLQTHCGMNVETLEYLETMRLGPTRKEWEALDANARA